MTAPNVHALPDPPEPGDDQAPPAGDDTGGEVHAPPYVWGPDGLVHVRVRKTRDAEVRERIRLANFGARIVEDVTRDDGADTIRRFTVEVVAGGPAGRRRARVDVPASRLGAPDQWALEALGAEAVVAAGQGARDHVRAAVQHFSGGLVTRRVYVHTGWRTIDGRHVYLHAGGAIGGAGPVEGVDVDLTGPLELYRLPSPPEGDDLADAVRVSCRLLGACGARLGVVLLAAVARAALPVRADGGVFLVGPTGAGKSEAAALAQQHYGAGMDRARLPAAWSSTANALEELAYAAKDAVLTVDDFAPAGTPADVGRLHATAERLLRAQGNTSGRARMDATARLRPARPPRGLVLATGEDLPRGQSLRARTLVVEVTPETVDFDRLTEAQADAAAGRYAQAFAGYVQWLAAAWDTEPDLPARLAGELRELRAAAAAGSHRRTPDLVASFAIGWRAWLAYAVDVGALTEDDAADAWKIGWEELIGLAADQAEHLAAQDPARRFVELVAGALAAGRAHLDSPDNGPPPVKIAAAAGWQREHDGTWRPGGPRVGWLDGPDAYLLPSEAHRVATVGPEPITITERTLRRRLAEGGWLATTERETARHRVTVRRYLGGRRVDVLHLHAHALGALSRDPADPTDPTTPDGSGNGAAGSGPGPVQNTDRTHETGPRPAQTPPWVRWVRSVEVERPPGRNGAANGSSTPLRPDPQADPPDPRTDPPAPQPAPTGPYTEEI